MRLSLPMAAVLLAGTAAAEPDLLREFSAGPMAGVQEIIFAVRFAGSPGTDGHWYANFGYYGPDASRKAYGEGARLCRLNLKTGRVATLLDDPRGGVRDPQVDYDGRKILFSYRRGGTGNYHLYEIQADGSGLRQLTDGPFDDIEPTYLANGDIIFVSSRARRWVNCWLTQVATMHRADGDGNHIRAVSANNEQDNTPWPLPDGRILYTRWEYIDRSQVDYHHLWAMNPDGTAQAVFYGNLHPGTLMIDAKPIPGSRKIVAIFSPGHGRREHEGGIEVVDPRAGPDDKNFARKITKKDVFRDPWAFSENAFVAASNTSIVLVNGTGDTQQIYRLSDADAALKLQVHEPRPLAPRPRERAIPSRVDPLKSTGTLILSDVNHGRNMQGVKPGEIRKLLVLESLPMPIHYTGGMEPISFGGTFTLERVAGTVPVEPDGSAYFELPAGRSFFFVAMDKDNLSVKRMQSFVALQPGETTSCVGCHEERTETPPHAAVLPAAVQRAPSRIQPIAGIPEVFDFPRDIQPILNRHCLGCHDYDRRAGDVILSGDRGPVYSHSYFTLTVRGQVADGRNRARSNYPPRELGSSASPLMKKLLPGHHGVQVSDRERDLVRWWIESGAPYPGTYAALGTGMIGSYIENQLQRPDLEWPAVRAAAAAISRRCGACHTKDLPLPLTPSDDQKLPPWNPLKPKDLRRQLSRHMLYNLTRPEKSMLLLAPLARAAGGYGLCKAPVFTAASDPDYATILAGVAEAGKKLAEIKRFDMPGFRPRVDWVREMKRFGILPATYDPADAVDYYAVEQAYWKSLWYTPR